MAAVFLTHGKVLSPDLQVPAATSQVVPVGQQWVWSEQQTALGSGQQPYWPEESWQQVLPDGQDEVFPGHSTVAPTWGMAAVFLAHGKVLSPDLQVPAATSQVVPVGQQ